MLVTTIDFNIYKKKLEEKLNSNFLSYNELEDYLKIKLGTGIGKYITDIIRAINILNNLDRDDKIRDATEIELIMMANLTQNREKLLKYKNQDNVSRYLSTITDERIDLLKKLSEVFDDKIVEPLVILDYNTKAISNQKLLELLATRLRDNTLNIASIEQVCEQYKKKLRGYKDVTHNSRL